MSNAGRGSVRRRRDDAARPRSSLSAVSPPAGRDEHRPSRSTARSRRPLPGRTARPVQGAAGHRPAARRKELEMTKNIVETAREAGSFTTLLAAVDAAGLGKTLAEAGPFTVFAPTDEAFAKLPAGTIESLLADPAKLTEVLTYHVVPGRVTAA